MLLGKKTNVLLVKDNVGKSKPTTRDLPENNFVFGNPNRNSLAAVEGNLLFLN